MTTQREALELARRFISDVYDGEWFGPLDKKYNAIAAIDAALAEPEQQPVAWMHPDDMAVDAFAAAMKEKLAEKRAQGYRGWDDRTDCPPGRLARLLNEHLAKGDPLDVGNFAMMLWNRQEPCEAPAPAQQTPADQCRGYANLGIGAYIINHSAAGSPAELVITLATERDIATRTVGDTIDNDPAGQIEAKDMVIRIGFANEAGMSALENQLRMLRDVHFRDDFDITGKAGLMPDTGWDAAPAREISDEELWDAKPTITTGAPAMTPLTPARLREMVEAAMLDAHFEFHCDDPDCSCHETADKLRSYCDPQTIIALCRIALAAKRFHDALASIRHDPAEIGASGVQLRDTLREAGL